MSCIQSNQLHVRYPIKIIIIVEAAVHVPLIGHPMDFLYFTAMHTCIHSPSLDETLDLHMGVKFNNDNAADEDQGACPSPSSDNKGMAEGSPSDSSG